MPNEAMLTRSKRSMQRWLSGRIFAALATLLIAGCGGGGGGSSVTVEGTGPERIDSAVTQVMSRWDLPGVAVGVVRDGRLVIATAYGTADIDGDEPLRPDHLFRVASVSKPIIGIAALRAADEGLLDINGPAFNVLDDYRPPPGEGDPRLDDITVWHLMHHTPGWDEVGYPDDPLFRSKEIADDQLVPSPPDPAALTRWIAKQPLNQAPGTRFIYTNIGHVVLGRVIEESTGFSYEDFVRRFVFEPVGVNRARLGGALREERLPDEVEYLSQRDPIWTSIFDGITIVQEPAYGGLNLYGMDASSAWVLSVIDLARLGAATDGDDAYPELLTPLRQQQMIEIGTPPGETPYGAGWFLGTRQQGGLTVVETWEHSGGMPGTVALLARFEDGVILAVAANADARGQIGGDLLPAIANAVRGITDWPTTDLFDQFP